MQSHKKDILFLY